MRVALITSQFPPEVGGIGDYTANLAGHLAKRGFQVEVVTREGHATPMAGAAIHPVIPGWGLGGLARCIAWLRRNRPEVVLWQYNPFAYGKHGIAFAFMFFPLLARSFAGAKVVVTVHEARFDGWFSLFPRGLIWSVVQRLEFWWIARTSHAAIVTSRQLEWIARRWRNGWRTERVPVGSNAFVGRGRPPKEKARGPVAVFFGMLDHRSSSTLLHVAAQAMHARGGALVLLGKFDPSRWEGSLTGVKYIGTVTEDEASWWFRRARVCVLPFRDGATGGRTTMATALAHGCPVLTTCAAWTDPELLERDAVVSVPCGDVEAFRGELRRLLDSGARRKRVGQAGRKLYECWMAWPVIARKYGEFLRQVVE